MAFRVPGKWGEPTQTGSRSRPGALAGADPGNRGNRGQRRSRWFHGLCRVMICVAILVAATGCTTAGRRLDREAEQFGFSRYVLTGSRFRHVIYYKPGKSTAGRLRDHANAAGGTGNFSSSEGDTVSGDLHVYLDGDGSPWVDARTVAADPTPRNPLVLRLMALDPAPALYLGRPCYVGLAADAACEPYYWTHGRYAPTVVESLAMALNRRLQDGSYRHVVLLGLSGGGTLAMLLAPRIPQVRAVVTAGANLDIDRWADRHGYSHLAGSLNPASMPPLPAAIRQYHWTGALDRNVPPEIVASVAGTQPNAEFTILEGCDHLSCWEQTWPDVLRQLQR